MKQKLLNNFRLRAVMLVAMMCTAFTGAWAETKTDVLNQTWTGVSGTNYKEVSNLEGSASDAVYKAQCAGGNNSIQLRSNNSNSGVVSTTSGGKVRSITVTWNSNTTSGRTLNVYGKSEAYSAASDLYNSSSQGTLLGTIVCGTSTKLEIEGDYEYIGFRSASGAMYLDEVQIEWEVDGGGSSSVSTTTTIDASGITNTDVYAGTEAGALSATVSAGETIINNATITWSGNNDAVATIDASTGAVTLVAAGSVTFTATYAGVENTYNPSSKTYVMTVTSSDPNAPGTENNPYDVTQARAAIDAGTGVTGVYATGIVSAIVTAYNSTYGNISYNISADGSTNSDQLQAFRGKSYNGDWFTSADDIQVGDVVVVYGNLKKYSSTYEFDADNQLVSLDRPVASVEAPTFSPAAGTYADAQNVTISCETADATIYYTTDGTEPTNQSTEYTSAIAVNADMTIKAIAYDVTGANSTVATATYHICSADNPYTVTQALAFSEYPANGVYVSGIVSTAPTQSPTNDGQLTYYISVNGEATNQLQVYKGLGLNEAAFTAQDDIQVGDEVTIYGNVKIYNNTKEFDTGNYLVAFNRPATPTITVTSTSLTGFTYLVDNGPSAAQQITVGGENLTNSWSAYLDDYGNSNFEFSFTEDGDYFSETGIGSMPNQNQNVLIYVRLKSGLAVGDYNGAITISSKGAETVTVNLSGSVAAALEAPVWSELPTETISVGEDYVLNLADYVSGSPVPAISIETGGDIAQFEDNILYFTPTEAGSYDFTFSASNSVGSVNAILTVTVSAPASIEPSETAINIPAATTTGYETIEVTYKNFTNQPTAHERFYDDDDNILTSNPATWIIVGTSDNNIFYQVMEENTSSEPRSVHFRIWAYDGNQQGVSSELITITQAGVPVTDDSYQLYTGALTEGDYIIYYGEKAMNTTVSSDRLQYAEVTPENDVITTSDASIVWHIAQSGEYWTIYNVEANAYAAGTGAKNKAQMLDDGTDDKALWTVSGTETYEFVNKANAAANVNANLRNNGTYGFACYATGTGGALTLYKKATNTPSITITPDTYEMDAKAGGGELPVVSAYLADDPKLEVVFVEADGETLATYDWISATINANGNIDGQIEANTGDARTAYFYVKGVDDDNNTVKSNLVTFTQEAAITEPYITVKTGVWNFDADGGSHTFGFDFANLGDNPTFEVAFFDQTGETEIECGWISYEFVDKVTISAMTNDEGAARTAYFKVCAEVNKTMIYSNLVTVNQAAPVAPVLDYATLPFNWSGGAKADLLALDGVTANSLGSDYAAGNAPYLVKFDGTGDYIQVKTDSRPGVVSVGVKMIGGAETSTITVQESADGESFTDVEELSISGKQNDVLELATTNAFAEESRYVRLLFTKGSNVGVGPISISKDEPRIIAPETPFEIPTDGDGATFDVTTVGITGDLHVMYCDANGNELIDPTTAYPYDWLTVGVHFGNTIQYSVDENTSSESRTGYVKIYGTDANNNTVYSNLVTFTQAGFVPSITIEPEVVNIDAVVGDELISSTITTVGITGDYQNLHVQYYDVNGNEINGPEWCPTTIHHEMLVYNVEDNTSSEALTAYMKVYGTDANNNTVYSNLVTVNQAANVPTTTYSLATSITAGKHYLIVGSNSKTQEYYAIGLQANNNRSAVQVSNNNGQISITDENVAEVVVYGPDASGNYTIYNAGTGYLYAASSSSNHLKSQSDNDLNGKWAITFNALGYASVEAQGDNSRNVMQFNSGNTLFSCYSSDSQSPVYFFEKDNDDSEAYTANVTLNAFGYATFASNYALDFLDNEDANYSAWQIAEVNNNTNTITFEQITGMVAPATGILLKGKASNVVNLNVLPAGGATLGDNKLVGITESTQVGDNQYFGLKGNEFVKVNTGVVPAGKALLPIDNPTAGVKSFTFIFNDADGIQTIETVSAEKAQAIFNLAGQRLPKAQKGINIINGKKVLVK